MGLKRPLSPLHHSEMFSKVPFRACCLPLGVSSQAGTEALTREMTGQVNIRRAGRAPGKQFTICPKDAEQGNRRGVGTESAGCMLGSGWSTDDLEVERGKQGRKTRADSDSVGPWRVSRR